MYFKPGMRVLLVNRPDHIEDVLGDVTGIELSTDASDSFDGLLLFVKNSTELSNAMEIWGPRIAEPQLVWIAYPKKTSGIQTDLKMGRWKELDAHNLTPCGSAAIDDTWTGLRIKPANSVKRSGVGNSQIRENAYSAYIDVDHKKVIPPADLARLLDSEPEARNYFESLAYSHKKEYVLWILTAKQEQTRASRLKKTLEMLLEGKKSPTVK